MTPSTVEAAVRPRCRAGAAALVALALSLAPAAPATSDSDTKKEVPQDAAATPTPAPADAKPVAATLPVFVPPQSGRPVVRLRSASARGTEVPRPVVSVLAPERVGLTTDPQPVLYWHLDRVPRGEAVVLFALTLDTRDDPVAEFSLPMPEHAGVQRLSLGEHGVRLEPGIDYEWSVALVADPERWSQNIFSIGGIHYAAAPSALDKRLRGAGEARANVYASMGYWYDAYASAPAGAARDALLQQVGLQSLTP